ncbi:MAG: PTS sugar transporter subunit IIBC [Peptostreptococcaceae bacterium]
MNRSIVVVCDNHNCVDVLISAGKELGIDVKCEIQSGVNIENELSESQIKEANAILFAVDCEIEEIENIERFIDCEYYEVESKFVLKDAKNVIVEILSDLN